MAEGKNGYEIREGLLHLAHEILQSNATMRYDASKKVVAVAGGGTVEHREWTGYSVEDVIEAAAKLNDFVQRK